MARGRRAGSFGKCQRWLPIQMAQCGKTSRYLVYDTRRLCKSCYQRFMAGRETLFDMPEKPSPATRWAFWERLRADVPAR